MAYFESADFNLANLNSLETDGTCMPEVTIQTEDCKKFARLVTIYYGSECIDEQGRRYEDQAGR